MTGHHNLTARPRTWDQLTEAERDAVISRRCDGQSWPTIEREFNVSWRSARLILDPVWAEKRREQINRSRRDKPGKPGPPPGYADPTVSRQVDLADVRRRQDEHYDRLARMGSLTASFLGDPPPGRSALDRERAARTSQP